MELEIRPEPSDQERAAIAAALAEEADVEPAAWPHSVLPAQAESDEP